MTDEHARMAPRHLFYTKECVRTTWKLRVAAPLVGIVLGAATREVWIAYYRFYVLPFRSGSDGSRAALRPEAHVARGIAGAGRGSRA